MNNLLASFFSPSQTVTIVAVAVVGVVLIVLNVVLWYVFHKRGERKLYDRLLQQQRELLMSQLEEMRSKGDSGATASQQPFFTNTVYVPVPAPVPEEAEEPAAEPVAVETFTEENGDAKEDIAPEEEFEPEEEVEEASEEFAVADDEEIEEVVIVNGRKIRYNRSFTARIIQGSDELKQRYSFIKNYLLSYKGVKNRISWKRESFRIGRNTFASLVVRGKTLCLCLATNPDRFNDTKYKVVDLSVRSPKSKLPCMYRISRLRRLKYAAELIDLLMSELGASKLENYTDADFTVPYRPTEELIEEGLIKVSGDVPAEAFVEAAEACAPTVEVAVAAVEEVLPVEESAQAEQPIEEVAEQPVEEVTEEISEQLIEEPTEEEAEEVAEEDVLPERDFEILEEVDVDDTVVMEAMPDEAAEQLVEIKVVKKQKAIGKKKGIVNIDTLSKHYGAGDRVTVESLHEKGIIPKDVKVIKVLANGVLNKPLIVEADDFSIKAVKMIVLTGGRVIRKKIFE